MQPSPVSADETWRDALGYDLWFDTRWGRYASRVEARAVLRAMRPVQGTAVIDVGTGTGRLAAQLPAAGIDLVAIDRERAMLTLARKRIGASLVAADVLALPVRDQSVDIALAVTVLEFVADASIAMAELARVVRPGGRIVVGALNPRSPWGVTHHAEFGSPPWNAARFFTRDELRALGAPHGRVHLNAVLYAPNSFPLLGLIGPLLEQIGRAVPMWGAFQVLVVERRPTR
jgi:SAM-dependent methyltransferase